MTPLRRGISIALAVADAPPGGVAAWLWVYRAAVVVAIAGAAQYRVRLIRGPRAPSEPARAGVA